MVKKKRGERERGGERERESIYLKRFDLEDVIRYFSQTITLFGF
jgi:hypothetical protein